MILPGTPRFSAKTWTPAQQFDLRIFWDDITKLFDAAPFTPVLTNVANLAASTAYECQYLRIGSQVVMSGRVDVDPTAGATLTQLGISLPVPSLFISAENCAGVAFASGIAGQGAAIRADVANGRAEMVWISGDVSNQAMYLICLYRII